MSEPGEPMEQMSTHYAAWELMDRRTGAGIHARRWLAPESRERYVALVTRTLQVLRSEVGAPLRVISGERAASRTAASSYHMPPSSRAVPPTGRPGAAADVATAAMSPVELACLTLRLMGQGSIPVGGVGTYSGYVHVDDRGRLALWRGAGVSDADWNRVQAAARSARAALAAAKEVGR